jgi:hypothetical protein
MENNELPGMLRKYFWDCDFEALSMKQYPVFISERILNLGDVYSLKWLFGEIDKGFLIKLVDRSRNLNKKTKNYWKLMICQ